VGFPLLGARFLVLIRDTRFPTNPQPLWRRLPLRLLMKNAMGDRGLNGTYPSVDCSSKDHVRERPTTEVANYDVYSLTSLEGVGTTYGSRCWNNLW
jgi:hypothetical protein